MFEKIALIGIGLIGGSIALDARKRGLARSIVAATRSAETAATANRLKLVDHCGTDLAAAVEDADLVIVCTPVGVSAGGTAGLTLMFGVTGAVKPYADYDVLNGTYKDKWEGQPLTSFTLLKPRPIFTYVVNFGKPLTTDKSPPIPTGKEEPPAVASTARPLTGKAEGKTTPTEVVRKPEQEKTPEDKPEADSKGGFDLKGMVSGLKNEPKFAKAIAIMDAAAAVWDAIAGVVGAIVNFVRKWVGGAIDLIVGIVKAIGKHNVSGFLKDFLKKRLDPLLFHIIEPLIDVIGKVEDDLYDLFEIELPTSPGGALEFALTVIKKVLKLAWDSFTELVDAIITMVRRAIEGAREFAQYLVQEGRLGVVRRGRYIGSKTLGLTHDFLLADEYKVDVGGVTAHELDDSVLPSVDKAIGFGLWHALDLLGVEPTTSAIDPDTGEAYADYWQPLPVHRSYSKNRKVRGTGAVAANAAAALDAADREPGVALPGMLRRRYESALGADLSEVRIHTGATAALAARAIDARAYTSGRDIHFDSGEFAPGTSAGDLLLAHELAHAAWAPRADRRQYGLDIAPATDPSEHMADAVSQRITAAAR